MNQKNFPVFYGQACISAMRLPAHIASCPAAPSDTTNNGFLLTMTDADWMLKFGFRGTTMRDGGFLQALFVMRKMLPVPIGRIPDMGVDRTGMAFDYHGQRQRISRHRSAGGLKISARRSEGY
jgi:hypothetical protein